MIKKFNASTILGLVMLLVLASCDKKEKEVAPILDDIIGIWTAIEANTIISYQDMSAYDYWISQGYTTDEATYQVGYQTRGHGDYVPIIMEVKTDGTYTSQSGKVGDESGSPNNGTWKLSDDKTILTFDGFEIPVLTLSKNALTIQLVFDSNEYTMDQEMTYDITISYVK